MRKFIKNAKYKRLSCKREYIFLVGPRSNGLVETSGKSLFVLSSIGDLLIEIRDVQKWKRSLVIGIKLENWLVDLAHRIQKMMDGCRRVFLDGKIQSSYIYSK